jgi:hypothetical protein
VAGRLDPAQGAKLIHEEAAAELDHPEVLRPIVAPARAPDLPEERPSARRHVRDRVVSAARDFLAAEADPERSP